MPPAHRSPQDDASDDSEDSDIDNDIDPEGPDVSDQDFSDEPDLEICPNCRRMISEDADRCPHCGEYVSPGDAPLSMRAWIAIAVLMTSLIALLFLRR